MKYILLGLLFLPIFLTYKVQAQSIKAPALDTKNGIGIVSADSLFSLNFRFRTQLRAGYTTISGNNLSADEIEARIRRLRLRFRGFAFNPKLTYYIQLSFSRGDMDWVDNQNSIINSSPNVIRDAIVAYQVHPNLSLIFGQTKLPGNRQRVNSSSQLQFPDRSIVNARFNIDRDFGLQFVYINNMSSIHYRLKGAITTGEGRNSIASDAGLAYTGRMEILPFGEFTNKGDYFEGDLEREKTPKLSIGGGYHFNEGALRTAGTIGNDLYEQRNISSAFVDLLLKYRGIAFAVEYLNRNANGAITSNNAGDERIIYIGEGLMTQFSYLFTNDIELAGRYAIISPYNSINTKVLQTQEMGIGVTKYLQKHKVKLQAQLLYYSNTDLNLNQQISGNWNAMFQIELGI